MNMNPLTFAPASWREDGKRIAEAALVALASALVTWGVDEVREGVRQRRAAKSEQAKTGGQKRELDSNNG